MVPLYAFDSWISVIWLEVAVWVDMVRDLYEGYVIYLFLSLMMEYVGGGNKDELVRKMSALPPVTHPPPVGWFYKPVPLDYNFIKKCKFATLTYSVCYSSSVIVFDDIYADLYVFIYL